MYRNYKKLNNSASLIKTTTRLPRRSYNHSYVSEPKEFDIQSAQMSAKLSKEINKNTILARIIPNYTSHPTVPINLPAMQSHRRSKVLVEDIRYAIIQKSMNLTIMYRDMHRFIVNISELRWILTEANLLMKRFETIQSHTGNDYTKNLSSEMYALLKRFLYIEAAKVYQVGTFILGQRNEADPSDNPEGVKEKDAFPSQLLSVWDHDKENIDKYKSQFDNIAIGKFVVNKPVTANEKYYECAWLRSELEAVYAKCKKAMLEKEQSEGQTVALKSSIKALYTKLLKYQTYSARTTEFLQLAICKLNNQAGNESNKVLLAQMQANLLNWSTVLGDDQKRFRSNKTEEDDKYDFSYDRTAKMKYIIGLQYYIDNLRATKDHFTTYNGNRQQRLHQYTESQESALRMMLMQAATIEEIAKLC